MSAPALQERIVERPAPVAAPQPVAVVAPAAPVANSGAEQAARLARLPELLRDIPRDWKALGKDLFSDEVEAVEKPDLHDFLVKAYALLASGLIADRPTVLTPMIEALKCFPDRDAHRAVLEDAARKAGLDGPALKTIEGEVDLLIKGGDVPWGTRELLAHYLPLSAMGKRWIVETSGLLGRLHDYLAGPCLQHGILEIRVGPAVDRARALFDMSGDVARELGHRRIDAVVPLMRLLEGHVAPVDAAAEPDLDHDPPAIQAQARLFSQRIHDAFVRAQQHDGIHKLDAATLNKLIDDLGKADARVRDLVHSDHALLGDLAQIANAGQIAKILGAADTVEELHKAVVDAIGARPAYAAPSLMPEKQEVVFGLIHAYLLARRGPEHKETRLRVLRHEGLKSGAIDGLREEQRLAIHRLALRGTTATTAEDRVHAAAEAGNAADMAKALMQIAAGGPEGVEALRADQLFWQSVKKLDTFVTVEGMTVNPYHLCMAMWGLDPVSTKDPLLDGDTAMSLSAGMRALGIEERVKLEEELFSPTIAALRSEFGDTICYDKVIEGILRAFETKAAQPEYLTLLQRARLLPGPALEERFNEGGGDSLRYQIADRTDGDYRRECERIIGVRQEASVGTVGGQIRLASDKDQGEAQLERVLGETIVGDKPLSLHLSLCVDQMRAAMKQFEMIVGLGASRIERHGDAGDILEAWGRWSATFDGPIPPTVAGPRRVTVATVKELISARTLIPAGQLHAIELLANSFQMREGNLAQRLELFFAGEALARLQKEMGLGPAARQARWAAAADDLMKTDPEKGQAMVVEGAAAQAESLFAQPAARIFAAIATLSGGELDSEARALAQLLADARAHTVTVPEGLPGADAIARTFDAYYRKHYGIQASVHIAHVLRGFQGVAEAPLAAAARALGADPSVMDDPGRDAPTESLDYDRKLVKPDFSTARAQEIGKQLWEELHGGGEVHLMLTQILGQHTGEEQRVIMAAFRQQSGGIDLAFYLEQEKLRRGKPAESNDLGDRVHRLLAAAGGRPINVVGGGTWAGALAIKGDDVELDKLVQVARERKLDLHAELAAAVATRDMDQLFRVADACSEREADCRKILADAELMQRVYKVCADEYAWDRVAKALTRQADLFDRLLTRAHGAYGSWHPFDQTDEAGIREDVKSHVKLLRHKLQKELGQGGVEADPRQVEAKVRAACERLMANPDIRSLIEGELSGKELAEVEGLVLEGGKDSARADVARGGDGAEILGNLRALPAEQKKQLRDDPTYLERLARRLGGAEFREAQDILRSDVEGQSHLADLGKAVAGDDATAALKAVIDLSEAELRELAADPVLQTRVLATLGEGEKGKIARRLFALRLADPGKDEQANQAETRRYLEEHAVARIRMGMTVGWDTMLAQCVEVFKLDFGKDQEAAKEARERVWMAVQRDGDLAGFCRRAFNEQGGTMSRFSDVVELREVIKGAVLGQHDPSAERLKENLGGELHAFGGVEVAGRAENDQDGLLATIHAASAQLLISEWSSILNPRVDGAPSMQAVYRDFVASELATDGKDARPTPDQRFEHERKKLLFMDYVPLMSAAFEDLLLQHVGSEHDATDRSAAARDRVQLRVRDNKKWNDLVEAVNGRIAGLFKDKGHAALIAQAIGIDPAHAALLDSANRRTLTDQALLQEKYLRERGTQNDTGSSAPVEAGRLDSAMFAYQQEVAMAQVTVEGKDDGYGLITSREEARADEKKEEVEVSLKAFQDAKAALAAWLSLLIKTIVTLAMTVATGGAATGFLAMMFWTGVSAGVSALAAAGVNEAVLGSEYDFTDEGLKSIGKEMLTAVVTAGTTFMAQKVMAFSGSLTKGMRAARAREAVLRAPPASLVRGALNEAAEEVISETADSVVNAGLELIDPTAGMHGVTEWKARVLPRAWNMLAQAPAAGFKGAVSSVATAGAMKVFGSKRKQLEAIAKEHGKGGRINLRENLAEVLGDQRGAIISTFTEFAIDRVGAGNFDLESVPGDLFEGYLSEMSEKSVEMHTKTAHQGQRGKATEHDLESNRHLMTRQEAADFHVMNEHAEGAEGYVKAREYVAVRQQMALDALSAWHARNADAIARGEVKPLTPEEQHAFVWHVRSAEDADQLQDRLRDEPRAREAAKPAPESPVAVEAPGPISPYNAPTLVGIPLPSLPAPPIGNGTVTVQPAAAHDERPTRRTPVLAMDAVQPHAQPHAQHQRFAQHDAREAALILNRLPGLGHIEGITPDDYPDVAGCIRLKEAQTVIHAYDALGMSPSGRKALEIIATARVEVVVQSGRGYRFNAGPPARIYVDPSMTPNAHFMAGSIAHEAHHAATFTRDVDASRLNREQYSAAALMNEAQAQAELLEHHREMKGELGLDHGQVEFGHEEYHREYDQVMARLERDPASQAKPRAELHDEARRQATLKLAEYFGQAVPSTSATLDPTGRLVFKEGAARTYAELYARIWDGEQQRMAQARAASARRKLGWLGGLIRLLTGRRDPGGPSGPEVALPLRTEFDPLHLGDAGDAGPEAIAELERLAGEARARNGGVLSVTESRELAQRAAELGLDPAHAPRASSPEEALRAGGMTDEEMRLLRQSLNADQQSNIADDEVEELAGQQRRSYQADHRQDVRGRQRHALTLEQLDAVLKANSVLYDGFVPGEIVAKVVPADKVADLLRGTTIRRGKEEPVTLNGDVGLARNTEHLGAHDVVAKLGLDYPTGGEHPFVEGQGAAKRVRPEVAERIYKVEQRLGAEELAAGKVVLGVDLHDHAVMEARLLARKKAADPSVVIPRLLELDDRGELKHIVAQPRVRASADDPSTGMGYTASMGLRNDGDEQHFEPNQELHLAGPQQFREGAELVAIDASGARTVVAVYQESERRFVPVEATARTVIESDETRDTDVMAAQVSEHDPEADAGQAHAELRDRVRALPGLDGVSGILADGDPPRKGYLSRADAERIVSIYALAASTPTGRAALQTITDEGVRVTAKEGIGSFHAKGPPPSINLDLSDGSDPYIAATIAHEVHHERTFADETDIDRQEREVYVAAALRNEAEAEAVAFDQYREMAADLGFVPGATSAVYQAFQAAYDGTMAQLEGAGLSAEDMHDLARINGVLAMERAFGAEVPSTIGTDSAGAAGSYRELYGNLWEENQRRKAAAKTAPATQEDAAAGSPKVSPAPRRDPISSTELARIAQQPGYAGPEPDGKAPGRRQLAIAVHKLATGAGTFSSDDAQVVLRQLVLEARAGLRLAIGAGDGSAKLTAEELGGQCGLGQSLVNYIGENLRIATKDLIPHQAASLFKGREGLNIAHAFNVVTLPDGKAYLVDVTMRQFFDPEQAETHLDPGAPGASMRRSERWSAIADQLIQDGFIELTDEVAAAYGQMFSWNTAGRAFTAADLVGEGTADLKYERRDLRNLMPSRDDGGGADPSRRPIAGDDLEPPAALVHLPRRPETGDGDLPAAKLLGRRERPRILQALLERLGIVKPARMLGEGSSEVEARASAAVHQDPLLSSYLGLARNTSATEFREDMRQLSSRELVLLEPLLRMKDGLPLEHKVELWSLFHSAHAHMERARHNEDEQDAPSAVRERNRENALYGTLDEIGHEWSNLRRLLEKGELTEKQFHEVMERKLLENQIEMEFGIELSDERGAREDGSRVVWTKEDLLALRQTLATVPREALDHPSLRGFRRRSRDAQRPDRGGEHERGVIDLFDHAFAPTLPGRPAFRIDGAPLEHLPGEGTERSPAITRLDAIVFHELGHNVVERSDHAAAARELEDAAGWKGGLRKEAIRGRLSEEEMQILEREAVRPLDQRAPYSRSESFEGRGQDGRPDGKLYMVDPDHVDRYLVRDKGSIPSDPAFKYAASGPSEMSAEYYAKAHLTPETLRRRLVEEPREAALAEEGQWRDRQKYADGLASALGEADPQTVAAREAARRQQARAEEAGRLAAQKRRQYEILRDGILKTGAAKERLVEELRARGIEPLPFLEAAERLTTPGQLADLAARMYGVEVAPPGRGDEEEHGDRDDDPDRKRRPIAYDDEGELADPGELGIEDVAVPAEEAPEVADEASGENDGFVPTMDEAVLHDSIPDPVDEPPALAAEGPARAHEPEPIDLRDVLVAAVTGVREGRKPDELAEVSRAQAEELFGVLARASFRDGEGDVWPIPFHFPAEACAARAQLMAMHLGRMGYASEKIFAVATGDMLDPGLAAATPYAPDTAREVPQVEWHWHVAPMIKVRDEGGDLVEMVLDPSVAETPLTVRQWTSLMRGGKTFERVTPGEIAKLSQVFGGGDEGMIAAAEGRPMVFSDDRDRFDLDLGVDPLAGLVAWADDLVDYAKLAQVHELAAAIRRDLAAGRVQMKDILGSIRSASPMARRDLAAEFPYLLRQLQERFPDLMDKDQIAKALAGKE